MKEYVLFSVLCFGCLCSAQFYDAAALDDYSVNDNLWMNDNDYSFDDLDAQLDKDMNIDSHESIGDTQNDPLKDEQSRLSLENTAPLEDNENKSDSQDKDLLDVAENYGEKLPISNNDPIGDVPDKMLSRELDAAKNSKQEANEVNEDVNLEDVKFDGTPIISNQTEFDKIMEETENILAESNSSDMDNIKSFVVEDNPKDPVPKVREDLNEDLSKLYNTWEKLKSDDENEVPDIFKDVSNKKDDENVEQEKLNINDIVELDENDNEHFDEVDFDKLFDDLNKDIVNAANRTQEIVEVKASEDIVLDALHQISLGVDDQEDETLLRLANTNETEKVTTIENPTTINQVNNLSSSEFSQLMDQFKEVHADDFADDKLRDSNPDIIHLEDTDIVTIISPNYPSPYPTNQIVDWLIETDGKGIELNVTDFDVNGALGDYVLFKPGGVDETGNEGIIMSYNLDSERKFRFSNVNKMFVRFEAKPGMAFKKGFSFNVKMLIPPMNTTTEEEIPPPVELLPEARHTLTVYLGGIPFNEFKDIQDDFKNLLADMATIYVNENAIETEYDASSITRLTSTSFCNINWPGFENCVAVTFTIPLNCSADDEEDWRLNENDLRAMWYTYIYMDPFAARLRRMGVEEFQLPNDDAIMTWWLVVGAAVTLCVLTLAVVLWRFSCLEDYTRMRIFSDSDSIMNEKRPLDLYPTPHQTLPPLYGDVNYSWPMDKGDNDTVDMSGYNNSNFVGDNILEFESDDEPVRDRGSNRNSFAANNKHII